MLLPAMCVSIGNATAQGANSLNYDDSLRIDSLVKGYHEHELEVYNEQAMKEQQRMESGNLSDLKAERNEAKAKAEEARRIESNANDAARETRIAYRAEKKAQKARKQADRQAENAAKARVRSDSN